MLLALVLLTVPASYDRLHSAEATASSFLKSNWNKYEENYHPTYVLDDNPKTAWVEGVDGDGAGEWLQLPVSTLASAKSVKLVVMNGYQKSKNLLEANAAPKKMTVIVLGPDEKETGRAQWTLERKMGPQSLEVPVKGGVAFVKLVVDEVHPGKTYKDLCISDVQVFVDSDVAYNAKAEQAKKKQALAWMKERIDTAKYFAKLPKEFPWASTRFTQSKQDLGKVNIFAKEPPKDLDWGELAKLPLKPELADGTASLLATNSALLQKVDAADRDELARVVAWKKGTKPAGAAVMRAERTGNGKVRVPEGAYIGDAPKAFLSLADVVLTEAVEGSKGTTRTESEEDYVYYKETMSNALVSKRADGTVERMQLTVQIVESDRMTSTTNQHWVMSFDTQGRLTTAAVLSVEDADHLPYPPMETFCVTRLTRDAAGKITEVKHVTSDMDWGDGPNDLSYQVRTATLSAQPTS